MKFTLTFEVGGETAVQTAEDLRLAVYSIGLKIASHYGLDQNLNLIPWGPLAGFEGVKSDVLAMLERTSHRAAEPCGDCVDGYCDMNCGPRIEGSRLKP